MGLFFSVPSLQNEHRNGTTPHTEDSPTSSIALDDASSKHSKKHDSIDAPPNGGIVAWMQLVAAIVMNVTAWGPVISFGVFQVYFEQHLLQDTPPSAIAWIGGLQFFVALTTALLAGPLYDKGYGRLLPFVGSVLSVIALTATSVCTAYMPLVLVFGLTLGVAAGLLYVTSVAIVGTYFISFRRMVAMSAVAAGSNFGEIIMSTMFQRLVYRIGFAWTFRAMALLCATLLVPSCLVLRPLQVRAGEERPFLLLGSFKEPAYSLMSIATLLAYLGLYIPSTFLPLYAKRENLGLDTGTYLLLVYNAASGIGRLVIPQIAGILKIGALQLIILGVFCSAVMIFVWISIHQEGALWAFAAIYGLTMSPCISLGPAVIAMITPNMAQYGTRVAMFSFVAGVGSLVGYPIGGALVAQVSFLPAQIFAGSIALLALLLLLVSSRFVKVAADQMASKEMQPSDEEQQRPAAAVHTDQKA